MTTLIAEDLLLLLLEDDTGRLTNTTYLDVGVGGALLVELALNGSVKVVKGSGMWARSKVHLVTAHSPADPVLAEAMGLVAEKDRTAQDLVGRLGKKRREPLLERLAAKGILRRQDDTVLGLFPRKRWPAIDSSQEADVRRKLGDSLIRGVQPDERTAALIALLSALGLAHKAIDREGLPAGDVRKRAKAIAEGDWAAKAVRDAVAAAQAAVSAAVIASTAAASSSGGS
ncbi:MAG: hypothetical protein JWR85_2153 [Marmoricola sp.]|nr:hypothetical protein [Marmoricola sp.]